MNTIDALMLMAMSLKTPVDTIFLIKQLPWAAMRIEFSNSFLLYMQMHRCDALNCVCRTYVYNIENSIYARDVCVTSFKLNQKMFEIPLLRQFVYTRCLYNVYIYAVNICSARMIAAS